MISLKENCQSEYPRIVNIYKQRYEKMAETEYKKEFCSFTETVLHDPIGGLDWKQLLDWEHRHLKYTQGELPKPRAEMPIDIVLQTKGRCGEFVLLYNGLLLTNCYDTQIVIDCSRLEDKSKKVAGDHVWNEVLIGDAWLHVDPTEKRIDQPLMYAQEWCKDINMVYAVTKNGVLDVTENYRVQT